MAPSAAFFRLQRTFGNQALAAAAQSAAPPPPARNRSADLHRIVSHTQAVTSARPALIQRYVMTEQIWKEKSGRLGKSRSVELLKIDEALVLYNAAANKPPEERMALLTNISVAIDQWKATKKLDKQGKIKSSRLSAVLELADAVKEEKKRIAAQARAGKNPTSAGDVLGAVKEVYGRAIHELHHFLALAVNPKSADKVMGKWKFFRLEAQALDHAAQKLSTNPPQGANPAELSNAVLAAQALRDGMRAFRTIAYRYLHVNSNDAAKSARKRSKIDLTQIRARLDTALDSCDDNAPNGVDVTLFLVSLKSDINSFAEMAGADKTGAQQGKGKLKEIEGDESEDWALIQELLNTNDLVSTITGYHAGTGNEGMQDFYKTPPAFGAADTRTDAQKGVADLFSLMDPGRGLAKLDSSDPANKGAIAEMSGNRDLMLGASDYVNAVGGMGSTVLSIIQAIKVIKDPKSSHDDIVSARLTLVQAGVGGVMNALKMAGAIMTIQRGETIKAVGDAGKGGLPGSNFGFTNSAVDASTDVKLAGDFAGAFAGILATIGQVIDYFKWMKKTADDPKAMQGGVRKDLELFGNALTKATGVASSLAGNFKAVAKLGYQIADGGQVTSDAATSVSNLGGVVPGIQVVYGTMQAIQLAYKLVRLGLRRGSLTERIDDLLKGGVNTDLRHVESIEFAHGTLIKRMDRVGISLGHALAGIVAGGLNLSGLGAAPGMAITLSSAILKVSQVGWRKGKQHGRDKSAKEKEQQGKTETYEEWKRRKQIAAGSSKWARFKAAMSIKFTFNWDKSSENKGATTREVALEILRMDDDEIYKALGVKQAIRAKVKNKDKSQPKVEKSKDEKLEIIVKALQKRD